MRTFSLVSLLSTALFAAVATGAHADVTFVKIADNTGPLDAPTSPTIADSGIVAFWSGRDAVGRGIYTGDGIFLRTIVEAGVSSGIGINQGQYGVSLEGYVAYALTTTGSDAKIYRGNGLAASTVIDSVSTAIGLTYSPIAINAFGQVAFVKHLDIGSRTTNMAVYRSDRGGAPVVRMKTGDAIRGGGTLIGFSTNEPMLSTSGHVAAVATAKDRLGGIYRAEQGTVPTISKIVPDSVTSISSSNKISGTGRIAHVTGAAGSAPAGVFLGIGNEVRAERGTTTTYPPPFTALSVGGVNARGEVVFWGNKPGTNRVAFYHDGTTLTEIADTRTDLSEISNATLNEGGTWALLATRRSGGTALFAGNRATPRFMVVGVGSALFDSTVSELNVINPNNGNSTYLNVRNQIAFSYRLANGKIGIARADISSLLH
jgi:hypothetical protein